jgi:arylformamidase
MSSGARPRVHDITVRLGDESIVYPGDRPYRRDQPLALERGDICDASVLEMSAHSGTHLDAPAHFLDGGATLDQFTAADFLLPAVVIDVGGAYAVHAEHLAVADVRAGDAVLFRTDNSRTGRCRSGVFEPDYVAVAEDAAVACVEAGVKLVGLDYISLERYGDDAFPTHLTLMRAGILLLEGADLAAVEPGRYELICLPLRMLGSEGSPVRAVLVEPSPHS